MIACVYRLEFNEELDTRIRQEFSNVAFFGLHTNYASQAFRLARR